MNDDRFNAANPDLADIREATKGGEKFKPVVGDAQRSAPAFAVERDGLPRAQRRALERAEAKQRRRDAWKAA